MVVQKINKAVIKHEKRDVKKPIFYGVFIIFILYAITLVIPLLFIVLNSFKSASDFFYYPLELSKKWSLDSYVRIFTDKNVDFNILSMFLNSTIISVGSTFMSVLSSTLAAYIIAKYTFKGKNIIYTIAILVMTVPTAGALASLYKFMSDVKLINTHIGVITLSMGGFGLNFFLLYGYFKNLSWSYAEAAKIDGANQFQVFYKIMLPQALPSLFAVAIISFIGNWNDYQTAYLFLRGYPTLAVGIQKIADSLTYGNFGGEEYASQDYPSLFAAMIFSIFPTVAIFAAFQKQIISNTTAGGLKG